MIITTAATIAGRRIANTIGLVRGTTVRSRHVGRDIMAGLKTIVGGEIASYTAMMEDARAEALQRLIADAEARGANAVTEHPGTCRLGAAFRDCFRYALRNVRS